MTEGNRRLDEEGLSDADLRPSFRCRRQLRVRILMRNAQSCTPRACQDLGGVAGRRKPPLRLPKAGAALHA